MALVRRAVVAHGGRDNLKKRMCYYWQGKGELTVGQQTAMITQECWTQLPGRLKMDTEYRSKEGARQSSQTVSRGGRTWHTMDGLTGELSKECFRGTELAYLASLLPLLDDKTLQLSALPDTKVRGQAATGVRVTAPDRAPVDLYFDKQSYLLVMMEYNKNDLNGQPLVNNEYFTEYKTIQGVPWPMKRLKIAPGVHAEVRITEVKFLKTIDPAKFAQPLSGPPAMSDHVQQRHPCSVGTLTM
jgi:hypothetical protein